MSRIGQNRASIRMDRARTVPQVCHGHGVIMASITKRVTTAGVSWRIQIRRQGEKPIHCSAGTKGEAKEIARKLEVDLDVGIRVVTRTMTVAHLIDRYLADMGSHSKPWAERAC